MSLLEKIAGLAKRRGFIYPGSEIYGGLQGTWDYGPLGVELKNNIKREFWRSVVQERDDVVGLDAAIFMNPRVWEASGHTEAFTDPLVECKKCHYRYRPDKPHEAFSKEEYVEVREKIRKGLVIDFKTCVRCYALEGKRSELTDPKQFNLLVEARLGAIEDEKQKVYLRGEITQGVHVNFKNVVDSSRVKIPFGVAQIGKAFRNEITPGQLTFRSREFEQMELQFYVRPDEAEGKKWFEYWKEERMGWYLSLGLKKENLRFLEHAPDKRAHYARAAFDIEYNFPAPNGVEGDGEWKEMEGIHHRGDWDLSRHAQFSGKDLTYFDEDTKERFIPWAIETSGGVDRATLFFLADAYTEEKLEKGEERVILKLHPRLAPYKAAVFPLLANKPELVNMARKIYDELKKHFMVVWDDRGNIGKRYRAQDEIGTPYCITVDFESLEKGDVTVRDRDTMRQDRICTDKLKAYLDNGLNR